MASDFTKYTNYLNNAGVTGVVFGADSPILEVELNEIQEIQKDMLVSVVQAFSNIESSVTVLNNSGIIRLNMYSDKRRFIHILPKSTFLINGILVVIRERIIIPMGDSAVALKLRVEELRGNPDTFKKWGDENSSETINNWAEDSRYNELTSMRKYVSYSFYTDESTVTQSNEILVAKIISFGSSKRLVYGGRSSDCEQIRRSYIDVLSESIINENKFAISYEALLNRWPEFIMDDLESLKQRLRFYINGMSIPIRDPNYMEPIFYNITISESDRVLYLEIQKLNSIGVYENVSPYSYDVGKDSILLEYLAPNNIIIN